MVACLFLFYFLLPLLSRLRIPLLVPSPPPFPPARSTSTFPPSSMLACLLLFHFLLPFLSRLDIPPHVPSSPPFAFVYSPTFSFLLHGLVLCYSLLPLLSRLPVLLLLPSPPLFPPAYASSTCFSNSLPSPSSSITCSLLLLLLLPLPLLSPPSFLPLLRSFFPAQASCPGPAQPGAPSSLRRLSPQGCHPRRQHSLREQQHSGRLH